MTFIDLEFHSMLLMLSCSNYFELPAHPTTQSAAQSDASLIYVYIYIDAQHN